MYCLKCGGANEEGAKYCIFCGEKLNKFSPTRIRFTPNPILITAGVFIIAALYLLPVSPYSENGNIIGFFSLAYSYNYCSFTGLHQNSSCDLLVPVGFLIGWFIALGLIVFGIFQKKKDDAPQE